MGAGLTCTPWATLGDLHQDAQDALAAAGVTDAAPWLQTATDILYAATGRVWTGVCPARTVRVEWTSETGWCERAAVAAAYGPMHPRLPKRLELPHTPVVAVTEVKDPTGAVVDPGGYELVNGRWLDRLVGGSRVPWEWSTLTVTYTHGAAPPDTGKRCAAMYATQLVYAWCKSPSCRLPQRVQTVARQQVTMTVLDPQTFLDKGLTGLPEIDQWIVAVNPTHRRQPATVWSPDTHHGRTAYL